MTDYIQWLLETEEEETEDALAWKTWSLAGLGGRETTLLWDQAEGDGVGGAAEDENGPERAARESAPSQAAVGAAELAKLAKLSARRQARLLAAEELAGAVFEGLAAEEKTRSSEALYRQGVRLERLAQFAGVPKGRTEGQVGERKAGTGLLPGLRALDRAFQRDARRYDGGFPLL